MTSIKNLFKYSNKVFFIFISILLIHSFDHNFGWGLNQMLPNAYFFTFGKIEEGWSKVVWNENGIIENLQVLLLFLSIVVLLNAYLKVRFFQNAKYFKYFILIELVGLTYFLLEEISWGQHFLDFKTFNFFLQNESFFYNKQGETNLHNISNLFNELPRSLVLIWCIVPIFIKNKVVNNSNILIKMICPSKKLLIISFVILFFVIPDLIISKLNLIDHTNLHIIENGSFTKFNLKMLFLITISGNFFRLSELQEFLYCYYFLWHSLFLSKYLLNKYNIKV